MRRAVVDLTAARPVWQVPAPAVAAIRRALGSGWEVVQVRAPAESDGDGGQASAEAVEAVSGAELYFGWGVPAPVMAAGAGTLRWVHSAAAGVCGSLTRELAASGVAFTNSRTVHAEPMADWAIAAIALSVRGFHRAVAAQREHRWTKDEFTARANATRELRDTRVGIVGLGGVGGAIARRCRALGMEVRGVRRHPGRRRPAGVVWVGGPGDLVRLARQSDVLVVAAPHTQETERSIGTAVLAALPQGAFVVNLSRGALLDEAALLMHLERGRLGGCVLDVVAVEPLPPEHRLWRHPKVLITPHVSAVSDRFWERETALIVDNIRRYRAGRRLRNRVEPDAGY